MRRRTLILGTGSAAATALAGCLSSAGGDENPSNSGERTIEVSATGETETDPDIAVLQASVEAAGEDAGEVRDELAGRGDELFDALVDFGIDEDDITTGDYNIRERIDERRLEREEEDPSEDDLAEYLYYEGSHSLTVEVAEVEDTGDVIDTAVDAGADTIGRIDFTLSDEKRATLREDALQQAIDDARSEAEFVAGEVDASIVEPLEIDTSDASVRPAHDEVRFDSTDDAADQATELHPDDVTVVASVEITYHME